MTSILPDRGSGAATAGSLLNCLLPAYDFRERHAIRVEAPPTLVYAALKDLTPGEVPILGLLMALRALPARLLGARGPERMASRPLLDRFLSGGFRVLAQEPGREIVVGVIGRFWEPRPRPRPAATAAAFTAFAEPGFAKAAMNFRLWPDGRGTRLTTETRIHATDAAARRAFGRYWFVIYPGSAAIRRGWLKAIKRRAEASTRVLSAEC